MKKFGLFLFTALYFTHGFAAFECVDNTLVNQNGATIQTFENYVDCHKYLFTNTKGNFLCTEEGFFNNVSTLLKTFGTWGGVTECRKFLAQNVVNNVYCDGASLRNLDGATVITFESFDPEQECLLFIMKNDTRDI